VVNPLPDGTTDIGCRYDEQTKLSAAGEYTFVIGTESQRAAIEQMPDVTFLPFSSAQPTALYEAKRTFSRGSAGGAPFPFRSCITNLDTNAQR
jgi:hypothetical protein